MQSLLHMEDMDASATTVEHYTNIQANNMEAPSTAVESYTGVQTNVRIAVHKVIYSLFCGYVSMLWQPLIRFKPGINFQYMLNAKGSTPAEILGTSYKTVLKPALNALADEAKRISVSKLDESIDLEKQLQGNVKNPGGEKESYFRCTG